MAQRRIYFSDFFEIDPAVLDKYGAFNVSLINDLPLFVDPFLLFDSEDQRYTALHEEIIRYVKFLRDMSLESGIHQGLLDSWFRFPEVRQNWLGFSKTGNAGSGLGAEFANALHKNLNNVFRNFGAETISHGSHLEKLCLIGGGVGRDHLSDFTTNLIKHFLLDYTQTFASQHIRPEYRKNFAVHKVRFNYETRRWHSGTYELPFFLDDYVLLTPKEILTKDEAWINRGEMIDQMEEICLSVPDDQLRGQINDYLLQRLGKDPSADKRREAAAKTAEKYPQIMDYYIRDKEDNADEAHKVSDLKVRETEIQFGRNVRAFVDGQLLGTEFYELGDSFDESVRRVRFLQRVIEDKDGWRIFYLNGRPLQRESDVQILYQLCWYATKYDVNREPNNGRGPVDYKVSQGSADKTLVEFKLAKNSKLKQNLEHQVEIYKTANDTKKSIKVIVYFSDRELFKVQKILMDLKITDRPDIVLIDARANNKTSASNVRSRR
jgi:hypothetical protein